MSSLRAAAKLLASQLAVVKHPASLLAVASLLVIPDVAARSLVFCTACSTTRKAATAASLLAVAKHPASLHVALSLFVAAKLLILAAIPAHVLSAD